MSACNIGGESERLKALHRYEILDSEPEEIFDQITRLALNTLQMPMAVISLMDHDRQWFKSRHGVDAIQTPRHYSFCTHTIQDSRPLIVTDSHADQRFSASPLVTGEPHVRSYVGVPLRTRDGFNIGALCSMDTEVRVFTDYQVSLMIDLSQSVIEEIERRTANMSMADGSPQTIRCWRNVSVWSPERFMSARRCSAAGSGTR
jgi:GAF domain-containing protein